MAIFNVAKCEFLRARRRFGGPGGPFGTPGARLPRSGGTLELLGALGALTLTEGPGLGGLVNHQKRSINGAIFHGYVKEPQGT